MIVTKLGGAICQNQDTVQTIAKAWRQHGTMIVVHGGGPQLTAALADLGETPRRIDGLRVTSPEAADVVRQVLDDIGRDLTRRLRKEGVPATHVAAEEGHILAATKDEPAGLERVGTFSSFIPTNNQVQVVTPVGWDAKGPLNINADEAAAGIAVDVQARMLHLATDVPGFMDEAGAVVPNMDTNQVEEAIDTGVARGGMVPKLECAKIAADAGLEVVIGSPEALTKGGTIVCS